MAVALPVERDRIPELGGEILGFLILYHAGRIGGDAVVPAVVAVHVDFVE